MCLNEGMLFRKKKYRKFRKVSKYKYELTTVGGLHSTFFSGQKFMMKFDGPCELYINSRDTSKFIQYIIDRVPKPPPSYK